LYACINYCWISILLSIANQYTKPSTII
jgi:hypothetical protein